MIRFECPTCNSLLQAPVSQGGAKATCGKCGQRLLVPLPAQTKTVLAVPQPDAADVLPGPSRRLPRRRQSFRCPLCGWRGKPDVTYSIATGGWILMGVGILFWPLIIAGVFLKEGWQTCPDCGAKVKRIGGVEFRA